MLGGPKVEEQVWEELKASQVDSGLLDSIRACYHEEMRLQVRDEELAALRARYGITVTE
jgi:hypothetical protein